MSSSELEQSVEVTATAARVTDRAITVDLSDGRTISVPTSWHPRLLHATDAERANYQLLPDGIEWPDVEADTSIQGLLRGHRSGENPECFGFWMENRKQGKRVTVQDWLTARKQKNVRK